MDHRKLSSAVAALMPRAVALFDSLAQATGDGIGITRASYGEGENRAWEILRQAAVEMGFEVGTDAAANLLIRMPGHTPDGAGVIIGSHLDSVPVGGNFDGAAGVVAGLITLAALRETGYRNAQDITVMGIRGEETAWFSVHHIGTRAALGLLPAAEIDTATRFDTGRTLAQDMAVLGCDVDRLRRGEPTWKPEAIKAFFELHIEQGPVLVHKDIPVAIVSGIRGNMRARHVKSIGVYAHSGALPRELRNDAVLAAVEFVAAAEAEWDRLLAKGHDMVLTVGKFHTDAEQHSHNKVPGLVSLCFDVRSVEQAMLEHMGRFLAENAEAIGARRRVSIDLGKVTYTRPAVMAPRLRAQLIDCASKCGVSMIEMASGGGHDAGDFANAGVDTAMVFVRNPNGSHNPDEHMEISDFCEAIKVLTCAVAAEAAT
jgi:beta-ureidopropionase / N-carbamoyl-L-amino-acid hydrolase